MAPKREASPENEPEGSVTKKQQLSPRVTLGNERLEGLDDKDSVIVVTSMSDELDNEYSSCRVLSGALLKKHPLEAAHLLHIEKSVPSCLDDEDKEEELAIRALIEKGTSITRKGEFKGTVKYLIMVSGSYFALPGKEVPSPYVYTSPEALEIEPELFSEKEEDENSAMDDVLITNNTEASKNTLDGLKDDQGVLFIMTHDGAQDYFVSVVSAGHIKERKKISHYACQLISREQNGDYGLCHEMAERITKRVIKAHGKSAVFTRDYDGGYDLTIPLAGNVNYVVWY